MAQLKRTKYACSIEIYNVIRYLRYKNRKEDDYFSKRKHLPKLVYGLMTLSVLRSKVKEHGLSAQGGFETLKSRLQKYVLLISIFA